MRVCVVGAGASGLPAIKSCLEKKLDVVCYEKTADTGGLWNFRPNEKGIGGTVMASTTVNTSKEMMAYSDFPPPEEWANFMHHSKVNKYMHMYAAKFGLEKYIQFNTTVQRISQSENGYNIELDNGKTEVFDKIMLCTGHHAKPQYPQLRDFEKFRGKTMHAQQYRDSEGFEGKDVFILGIGNSALDIAVDLAKVAKSVTISTRRGTWVFNRVSRGGMPYDTIFQSRYYKWVMDTIPWTVANDFMEHVCNQRMDHDIYGLRPNHRFFQQHPTVNDSLAVLISAGYITVTEDVDYFTEDSVVVNGGRSFPCDVFLMCTGYTFEFGYLEGDIIKVEDNHVDLYKYVFPVENSDIAVIGLIQPIGSIMPISEMQSRWVAGVFNGDLTLPPKNEKLQDMERKRKEMERRYFKSCKHTIQVDYVRYMDELAEIVGCMPPIKKYVLTNPRLALRMFMGPNAPYQYRIVGPDKWEHALQTYETVGYRVRKPMKNRECRTRRHKKRGTTDEWLRYASTKWICNWLMCSIVAFGFFFCAGNAGFSIFSYILAMIVLCGILSFLHLWFDLQYDMSTIL